ncbi:unnamed protein product [Acanthoscelides obtectus]|uniref:Serine/threonine-protein phosphatase n=2 Tax=Acanthoscelides obtectus TaxID=200917 RepID=A0A9P0JWZ5_ACAOB|nr:unnamed protein product [Acanthoscelides obtectus]CAK1632030.1 Serine/threonine-protein phosphatase PP1-2 [Acanthoscelides obtectus]
MAMFRNSDELCDVVSAAVFCAMDSTLMLTVENSEHWLPSVKVPAGQSWEKAVAKEVLDIFGIMTIDKVLKVTKVYLPRHATINYVIHVVFATTVDPGVKNKSKNTMGKYRGKVRWVAEADLAKLLTSHNLKSPEIVEYFGLLKKSNLGIDRPEEYMTRDNFCESCDDIIVTGKGSTHHQLVEASGIDKLAQESLLKEFVGWCFPANYMNVRVFSRLIPDLGWPKEAAISLFTSADIKNRYGLSFREFLYFLATVDPNTSHGGAAAEIRCRFMFRYYDRDKDGFLKCDEFKNVISDLRRSKKMPVDAPNVAKETSETYKAMGAADGSNISVMDFLKAICDLKIRGTSMIFRSSVGIIKYLKDVQEKSGRSAASAVSSAMQGSVAQNPRGKMTTPPMKYLDYEVAVHTLRIQRSGNAINIEEMKTLQEAISITTLKQPHNEQNRRISMDLFSQRSVSNELLKGLRYLTSINKIKEPKANYTWGQLDPANFARNLINVCNQVKEVFRAEPRMLELSSPCYIMGDLHGNVADLLHFERTLWHIGPGLSPSNLLFLGDYVDRGAYSIEVISYLFSYKLQSPRKMNLVRGNHEIRDVQKMFTFYKECLLKLGEKLGNEVWNAVNNAFDVMPLAAVVDGKLFCCHGGVPPPWLCPVITAINDVPNPLNQPDIQSSLAWELMWNDPVRPKTVNDKVAMELLANEGFAVNVRRGTAHVFSVDALERFLKANQLTHIVRAHEVAQAGFQC